MEEDQEIQEMVLMEVQMGILEADQGAFMIQEVQGPGGDPGAGPSGPGGGPPSGLDRPDDPLDRGDDGDGGDTAAAAAVQEYLLDNTVFDPTYSDIMDSFIRRLNYNPHYSRMGGIRRVV